MLHTYDPATAKSVQKLPTPEEGADNVLSCSLCKENAVFLVSPLVRRDATLATFHPSCEKHVGEVVVGEPGEWPEVQVHFERIF